MQQKLDDQDRAFFERFPSFTHDIAGTLTEEQASAYAASISSPFHDRVSSGDVLKNPFWRMHAAVFAYAGDNRMAHHKRSNTLGGLDGAAEMFTNLFSSRGEKHQAGAWIVAARAARARGASRRDVLACLAKAAHHRSRAADWVEVERKGVAA